VTFAATALCGLTPDFSTQEKGCIALDCVLAAALVTAVCLMVIGKIDLRLGPVGTLNNAWVKGFLAGAGAVVVFDGIALVMKAKSETSLPKTSGEERVTPTRDSENAPTPIASSQTEPPAIAIASSQPKPTAQNETIDENILFLLHRKGFRKANSAFLSSYSETGMLGITENSLAYVRGDPVTLSGENGEKKILVTINYLLHKKQLYVRVMGIDDPESHELYLQIFTEPLPALPDGVELVDPQLMQKLGQKHVLNEAGLKKYTSGLKQQSTCWNEKFKYGVPLKEAGLQLSLFYENNQWLAKIENISAEPGEHEAVAEHFFNTYIE
jgi:hypothetical protein